MKIDRREFLYADDLVLLENRRVSEKYAVWKNGLESEGLKVNVAGTKAMKLDGKKRANNIDRDPCAVCGKRATRNSIQCVKRVNKRRSDMMESLKF